MFWKRVRNLGAVGALAVSGDAAALPILSEVFYDATGSDNGVVFVEIFGAPGTSLEGLTLEGVNGSGGAVGPVLHLSGVIPADGLWVLADDAGDGGTSVENADAIANFDFQNGPDSIVLRSGDSVLDALGYGEFSAGEVFAGEGDAAADPAAGSSVARRFANIDTDDNAADFVTGPPTPGSAPLFPVPEPGSLGLSAGLLTALLAAARRRKSPCPKMASGGGLR